jgi:hypothetical protein
LTFAQCNLAVDWRKVVFTDSKYFTYHYSDKASNSRIWCKLSEKPKAQVQKARMQVHAYAGLSFYGVTPLFVATGTSGLKKLFTNKQG